MLLVFDHCSESSLISISRFGFFVEVGKSLSSGELMSPIFFVDLLFMFSSSNENQISSSGSSSLESAFMPVYL